QRPLDELAESESDRIHISNSRKVPGLDEASHRIGAQFDGGDHSARSVGARAIAAGGSLRGLAGYSSGVLRDQRAHRLVVRVVELLEFRLMFGPQLHARLFMAALHVGGLDRFVPVRVILHFMIVEQGVHSGPLPGDEGRALALLRLDEGLCRRPVAPHEGDGFSAAAVWKALAAHRRASLKRPAAPIRALSALPSPIFPANRAACAGHLLIASDLAASFMSLPGPMPTMRFHVAGVRNAIGRPREAITPSMTPFAASEGETALSRPRADVFHVGPGGQKGRVDRSASGRAVLKRRQVMGATRSPSCVSTEIASALPMSTPRMKGLGNIVIGDVLHWPHRSEDAGVGIHRGRGSPARRAWALG